MSSDGIDGVTGASASSIMVSYLGRVTDSLRKHLAGTQGVAVSPEYLSRVVPQV